jgi:hypothetical protein
MIKKGTRLKRPSPFVWRLYELPPASAEGDGLSESALAEIKKDASEP